MKRRGIVAVVAAAVAMAAVSGGPASAEPTTQQYKDATGTAKDLYNLYLSAEEEAFGWANASLSSKNQPQLYCPPKDLSMDADATAALFDSFLTSHADKDFGKYPTGLILLTALQAKYPCS